MGREVRRESEQVGAPSASPTAGSLVIGGSKDGVAAPTLAISDIISSMEC